MNIYVEKCVDCPFCLPGEGDVYTCTHPEAPDGLTVAADEYPPRGCPLLYEVYTIQMSDPSKPRVDTE